MAIAIQSKLQPKHLLPQIERMWEVSAEKILSLHRTWNPARGSPVYTVRGRYTSRGWTEWTQGFQFGSALLQYEATDDRRFLQLGLEGTLRWMPVHVTHTGVHDHGFNNISTYGNLLRQIHEDRAPAEYVTVCELALKVSGAVQAMRWTRTADGNGFIYSFNGPHSLFIDTIRTLRVLGIAHRLGHVLMGEQEQRISLLERLVQHARTTARYAVYYGKGRDIYDVRGRVAHESLFNPKTGIYRCPSTQQGYSPFSTWTRGLAWAICGFAEQLEFLETLDSEELEPLGGATAIQQQMLEAAQATADYYLQIACTDGVPVWDTGAPNLYRCPDYADRPSDPFNPYEPVDSSAAAIAAQGLYRLGRYLQKQRSSRQASRYRQAALTILQTLLQEPYLSTDPKHQGLLLHSVYHRPNGWDHIPKGQTVPCGESSMWGDYHLRELALLCMREAQGKPYLTFFTGIHEPDQ